MKNKILFIIFTFLFYTKGSSQCAMCRAVLENEEGQGMAENINDGIIYLMAIPYILVFSVGFLIYWKYFKTRQKS